MPSTKYTHDVYNAMGDLIASTDALGRTTRYTYDLRQEQLETVNADGTITTCVYDGDGNIITSVDELGRATQTIYDAEDRRSKPCMRTARRVKPFMTAAAELSPPLIQRQCDSICLRYAGPPHYQHRRAGTDNHPHVRCGRQPAYDYRPLGRTTTYKYDLLNRQTRAIDPLRNTTVTTYDADGNVSSIADPLNETTNYTYDVLNRLIATTNALRRRPA